MSTSKLESPKKLPMILLSMINQSSITGYDLSKQILNCWKSTHQQIYRDLNKMMNAGDIHCHLEPQSRRPDKKIYSITEQGKTTLSNMQVADYAVSLPNLRHDSVAMLKVENLSYFVSYKKLLLEAIKTIEHKPKEALEDKDVLLMDRAAGYYNAELDFTLESIELLKGKLNFGGPM